MHWNNKRYAGFSETKPWLKMNSNYPVFIYGRYDILLANNYQKENSFSIKGELRAYEAKVYLYN